MSMTESEVIEKLRQEAKNKRADADWKWRHGRLNADDLIQSAENMEQIAKWIEEIQQYRAIGTVKGYERAIQISIENYNLCREYKAKVQEFEAIGTVSEFRELKEKATQEVNESFYDGLAYAYGQALSIVSEVEAELGKDINVRSNGWIDVKDRLPEKDGYYLTCDHKGNIHVFYHHPSYVTNGNNMAFGICKKHPQFYQPIAWMELPNPYNRLERK